MPYQSDRISKSILRQLLICTHMKPKRCPVVSRRKNPASRSDYDFQQLSCTHQNGTSQNRGHFRLLFLVLEHPYYSVCTSRYRVYEAFIFLCRQIEPSILNYVSVELFMRFPNHLTLWRILLFTVKILDNYIQILNTIKWLIRER